MDRPLGDIIAERQRENHRRGNGRGRMTDKSRKGREHFDTQDIETDWVHDKYEDDPHTRDPRRPLRGNYKADRYSPDAPLGPSTKLRVDNLHYELTEDDLMDLFARIAPVKSLSLRFDRAGRSSGTAFVTYSTMSSANQAIREFDGANAAGQPIRLRHIQPATSHNTVQILDARSPSSNSFDRAAKTTRSLFDRIEGPSTRHRSERSSGVFRGANVEKATPGGIDRYIPASVDDRRSRSRSPRIRALNKTASGSSTRYNIDLDERHSRSSRRDEDRRSRRSSRARPRKTLEDLDHDMELYWGTKTEDYGPSEKPVTMSSAGDLKDVDMLH